MIPNTEGREYHQNKRGFSWPSYLGQIKEFLSVPVS